LQNEKVLEMSGGHDGSTRGIYLMSLNCKLKMVSSATYFYHHNVYLYAYIIKQIIFYMWHRKKKYYWWDSGFFFTINMTNFYDKIKQTQNISVSVLKNSGLDAQKLKQIP
jgi:hypothetical protein